MAINVKPLGDRVLVQRLEEKEVNEGEASSFPTRRKEKPLGEVTVVSPSALRKLDDKWQDERNARAKDRRAM